MRYDDAARGGDGRGGAQRWRLATEPREASTIDNLRRCLGDPDLWNAWLDTLAERPDLSALNIAAVAVKRVERGYADCADIRTLKAWEAVGASLRRGITSGDAIRLTVPHVREGGDVVYEQVEYWPRCCVAGAPRHTEHAPSVSYDLTRPTELARLARALEEVDLDRLPEMSLWALHAHFGFPTDSRPPSPPAGDIQSAKRLLGSAAEEANRAVAEVEHALASEVGGRRPDEAEELEQDRRDARRARLMQMMFERSETAKTKEEEAADKDEDVPGEELTILEEPKEPSEPPPVLPLGEAVAEARASLEMERGRRYKRRS